MNPAKSELFEKAPVPRAVLSQILPAIASQMIVLVYNLADTYFVGMLNDPIETAAVTVSYPLFLMLTALSNLFGVGGASAIARALGRKQTDDAREVSSVSFWCGLALSLLFSAFTTCFAHPLLRLCGAGDTVIDAASAYLKWVAILGGPFTLLNTLLANLVRSEGNAKEASFGVSLGGILNIILDPLFILPQFLGFRAAGAGMATALSNAASSLFLLLCITRKRSASVLSLRPSLLSSAKKHIRNIVSIGLPSALQYALTVVAVAAQSHFVSAHGIVEAVAALGIVKKIDQLPLYFSIGVSSGLLPFLAFNHAAGNDMRRKSAFKLGVLFSCGFSVLCLIVFEAFAPFLTSLFIDNEATVAYGASFLRIMVTAMPMMAVCYPMIIQFQAMGKAKESLICSILRKGVLDIPLLFLLDALFPLYGIMWVQPVVDSISLIVALIIYSRMNSQPS